MTSEDRNEGECFGPFHAGLICRDCMIQIRAHETVLANTRTNLETEIEDHILYRDALEAENVRIRAIADDKIRVATDHAEKAEAELAERTFMMREFQDRAEKAKAEVERLKALIKQLEDALKACIDETPAYETD